MTLTGGLAVYFVIWWTVLFAVLPFGVRSQVEEGTIGEGTEPGAPVAPMLLKKAGITSVVAGFVFALVWYIWSFYDF
jgi:predicted secreted protein